MMIYTIDFETFWSTEYSVSRMSPLEYVLDDRFQAICCGIKKADGPTLMYWGRQIDEALAAIDWSRAAVVAHNMSGFDAYILAYRYGVRPKMWMCTQAMARPLHAKTVGLSLAKLVAHYELGRKDNTVLMETKGRRLEQFTDEELRLMGQYCSADVDQCRALFKKLLPHHSSSELWQVDAITRMRTEPQFEANVPMLERALQMEVKLKSKSLLSLASKLGIQADTTDELEEMMRSELASAPKFAALLDHLGAEVPMKDSPTNPDKRIPALAKTDEEFIALQEHDDELVAAAARARLSVKSTLLETRLGKFITAARLTGGRLPIPLRYCGADTTGRDSGEEYNPQNLPRIPRDKDGKIVPKVSNALRLALRAPAGKVVIVADQSGIELRVNHFLWKVPSSMALYRADPEKADLYKDFASRLYDVPVDEVTKPQRQIGKISHLGLGFGAGPQTFRRVAKIMGGVDMPEHEAMDVTYKWRAEYQQIVDGWNRCGAAIINIDAGTENPVDPWGLVHTCAEGLHLPSGRLIRYPDLRQEVAGGPGHKVEWVYGTGRHKARIYGGKMDENIVQALARDSVFDCAVDFYKATGLRPALRVHDELVYVVDEVPAPDLLAELQRIMRTPPRWWPELVVWSEGDSAASYGEAK